MLNSLKEKELEAATKLIFDGLSMAKASMEQILQSPITIEKIDYGPDEVDAKKPIYTKTGERVHLIKTELKGELKGLSHLIFSESEVTKIYEACLPANVINDDSPSSDMMKLGFLTEIDNMVAAAVITEFANSLNLDIYGHVPSLQVMQAEEVNDFIDADSTDFDALIHFKAIFHGSELDISPDFVWIFQSEFVNKLKKVVV